MTYLLLNYNNFLQAAIGADSTALSRTELFVLVGITIFLTFGMLAFLRLYLINKRIRERFSVVNEKLSNAKNELNKRNQELTTSKNRLQDFMDSATSGIMIYDKDLNIVDCNKEVYSHINLNSKEEIIGRNLFDISPHLHNSKRHKNILKVFETGQSLVYEEKIKNPIYGTKKFKVNLFKTGDYVGLIGQDITEAAKATMALNKSERRHRRIFEVTHAAIWMLDMREVDVFFNHVRNEGKSPQFLLLNNESFLENAISQLRIRSFNNRAMQWLEARHRKEMADLDLSNFNTSTIMGLRDLLLAFAEGKSEYEGEWAVLTINGKTVYGNVYASFPKDELDNIIITVADTTRQKQNEIELREALRAKDIFLANISHEIRTPLNAVIGFTQLLREKALVPEVVNYADIIESSGETLQSLIGNILDFSKLNSKQMAFNKGRVCLGKVLTEMKGVFEKQCQEKGIKFELNTDVSLEKELCVLTDNVRLKQVITNLLSNAVKFTNKGKVALNLYHLFDDEDCYLTIKVMDSGIGMTKEESATIFQEFKQANDKISAQYGGTGLGLAISKQIIEQLGGSISVDSELGKGTTFDVRLKIARFHEEENSKPEEEIEIESNGIRILVAEDNPVNQILIKEILNSNKIAYDFAENGAIALDKLKNADVNYNLCLFDIRMPVMDGYEAVSIMRTYEKFSQIPVVALSADANQNSIQKAREHGFDDFLPKPFQIEELKSLIAKYQSRIQT